MRVANERLIVLEDFPKMFIFFSCPDHPYLNPRLKSFVLGTNHLSGT